MRRQKTLLAALTLAIALNPAFAAPALADEATAPQEIDEFALVAQDNDVNIALAKVQMNKSYARTGAAITPHPVVCLSLDQALPLGDDEYEHDDYLYKGRYFDYDDLMADPADQARYVYVLEEYDDYYLTYENNVEPGTATVVVNGIDDLYGSLKVSDSVRSQLGTRYGYERLEGKDRYETSIAICRWAVKHGLDWEEPCLASGKSFPDALAGAALAGEEDSVLLLVADANSPTVREIASHRSAIERLYVLGGQSAVSPATLVAIEEAAR